MSVYGKNNIEDKDEIELFKPCTVCKESTSQEHLIIYGARCFSCYQSYCRQAPAYVPVPDKYKNDPRGWAKRIIDKHESGAEVSKAALSMAKEALR